MHESSVRQAVNCTMGKKQIQTEISAEMKEKKHTASVIVVVLNGLAGGAEKELEELSSTARETPRFF